MTEALAKVQVNEGAILKHLGLNPNDPAAQALVLTCQRYGLDPILRHALLIDGRLYVTRDGLLHVAHVSGQLDGIEVLHQGEDDSHYIAKVAVYRKDMGRPFSYVGRYPKNGHNKKYGPEMAIKTAEVMALRRAFDVAIAAREEMHDDAEAPLPAEEQAHAIETQARPKPVVLPTWLHTLVDAHGKTAVLEVTNAIRSDKGLEPLDDLSGVVLANPDTREEIARRLEGATEGERRDAVTSMLYRAVGEGWKIGRQKATKAVLVARGNRLLIEAGVPAIESEDPDEAFDQMTQEGPLDALEALADLLARPEVAE